MARVSARLPAWLVDSQRRSNRASAGAWERFGGHRTRVTELLAGAAPAGGGGTLALLGAGNANDVDLEALAERYARVSLVDVDPDAVARAIGRQPAPVRERLAAVAPVDLSGALETLASWKGGGPRLPDLAALPDRAHREVMRALGGGFDVAASTGLLSQLLWTCERVLGEEHHMLQPVTLALAVAHLRSLVALARPGGRAVLVTDTASSETYPVEDLFASMGGGPLLDEITRTGVGFRCTNLAFVRQVLREDVTAAPWIADTTLADPWLWTLVPGQTLLVYGMTIAKLAHARAGSDGTSPS
jgi:hypothetical protein